MSWNTSPPLRRAASTKAPEPFVSTRTCRPCGGTGVGETFGAECETCNGTGDAPSLAPREHRRPVENEPPRPTEVQLDQLGSLIDDVHYSHPEHAYAADLIGRTDATETQVLAAIAALEPLLPAPRETPRSSSSNLLPWVTDPVDIARYQDHVRRAKGQKPEVAVRFIAQWEAEHVARRRPV